MKRPRDGKSISPRRNRSISVVILAAIIICAEAVRFAEADPQDLTVTASFEAGQSLASNEKIEFGLSRALREAEGRIAVLIGRTDISGLLTLSGNTLSYSPRIVPLPTGEQAVTVYIVSADNQWKQIAQFTLRVGAATQSSQPQNDASPQPDNATPSNGNPAQQAARSKRTLGFDKAGFIPSFTIGMKSQAAESHFPDSTRPPRPTFADFTLHGSMRSEMARGLFNSQTQFDLVGSSFQQEALRFGTEGQQAPRIDLSSYLLQFQVGKAKFAAGHISSGNNRHLINSFSSRGLSISLPLSSRGDFSIAAMNGTSIAGWSNFFGLNRSKHQILSASLGFEFIPERPGGLRVEASILDGRLLPISNFNQSTITDVERSRGFGFRLMASDQAQRWRFDGSFARSAFTNPADPLLYQGFDVVRVREVTHYARYLEASYVLLRDLTLSDTRKASLTLNYRHEQVDPLFRSVAAFTQADRSENQLEMVAAIGEATLTVSHLRFHDNLRDIPSILKTLSRRSNIILGTPLSSLLGNANQPSRWLPRVSYSFDEVHQFGASVPVNGGFELSLGSVPDQVSRNQSFSADWQLNQKLRFGYRFNRSFQDNRQIGRERADLRNLTNSFTVGLNPAPTLDLNFDVNAESALNKEMVRTDRTLRIGSSLNWRMTQQMALSVSLSGTAAGDTARTNRRRSAELDLQWSYRFGLERSRFKKVQSNLFVRYANRYASSRDSVFLFNNLTRIQTLNTGLSFTFF